MTNLKPNILWYCTDQQRYDTIHALGNKHIRTPNLDSLCKRGTAFDHSYCQNPICTPSRASFMTGRYPASTHVYRNGNEYFPSNERLVTKILSESGYICGLVGKLHLAASQGAVEPRTDDGYSFFEWSHHPYPDIPQGNRYTEWLRDDMNVDPQELYSTLSGAYGSGVPSELHQTTWCSNRAIDFINKNKHKPWLLNVNPFSPHPTFHPPSDYHNRYKPQDMPFPLFEQTDIAHQIRFRTIDQQTLTAVNPFEVSSSVDNNSSLSRSQSASIPPQSYDAREVKACYYADIEHIDYQFGRIIQALRETGQLENTLIIFMSDHGELLGDHGLMYKGCRFYDGLVRVPLIMSYPGLFKEGLQSSALVELIDIVPTILEIVGIEVPHFVQGKSLRSLLTGESPPNIHRNHVICDYFDSLGHETLAFELNPHDKSRGIMYFDGRYKLSLYPEHGIGELYDLRNDPGEFHDLWEEKEPTQLQIELTFKLTNAIISTTHAGPLRTKAY
jgi:arylsulfatase A-like enzyme